MHFEKYSIARVGESFCFGLLVALGIILWVCGLSTNVYAADRPNILFIMSDDHACNAISCYDGRLSKVCLLYTSDAADE